MVETDKAVIDFDAVEEGFLAKILVADGAKDVPVNSPIAVIVPKAADVGAFADFQLGNAATAAPTAPAAPVPAATVPAATVPVAPAASVPAAAAPTATAQTAAPGRVFASPAVRPPPLHAGVSDPPQARALAKEKAVDVAAVAGSGPAGRVVKADVSAAHVSAAQPRAAQPAVAARLPAPPAPVRHRGARDASH